MGVWFAMPLFSVPPRQRNSAPGEGVTRFHLTPSESVAKGRPGETVLTEAGIHLFRAAKLGKRCFASGAYFFKGSRLAVP